MKLDSYMSEADARTVYAIGSNSGFLFIGTPAEYSRDIVKINEQIFEALRERIAALSGKDDLRDRDKSALASNRERFKNFVPLWEREIIDVYETHEGQVMLKIEGDEVGKYWVYSEYTGKPEPPRKLTEDEKKGIATNYAELGREIVKGVAQDYEAAYKWLSHYFGKGNIPATAKECEEWIKERGGNPIASGYVAEYFKARRFFFGGTLGIYSGADPDAITGHIERLVDSGSSLAKQAAELAVKAAHRGRW